MEQRKNRAFGIDLGTTNSSAAEITWDPGSDNPPSVRVLEIEQPTREGSFTSPLVPSVVAVLPDGQAWVGEGAKRLRAFPSAYDLHFEKNLFYDTKNEIGLRKTYFRAPESFNHAWKIGARVLRFIAEEAAKAGVLVDASDGSHVPVAVTVPASFHLNQRRDTLEAAKDAGLHLADDDLLDEPTAALIDYFVTGSLGSKENSSTTIRDSRPFALSVDRPSLCVVFDFGGGTCDVSVVEISRDLSARESDSAVRGLLPPELIGLNMSHLAVSRYHRLGGGDIDAAIVHEILIPRLLAENKLDPLGLTFAQKKKGLEPQLLGKAEALKIALSSEISRLIKFGRYPSEPSERANIVVRQPAMTCDLGSSAYNLSDPSLSAEDFERLLAPFLDMDFLFARETEYRLTLSIFAPLRDAMDRASRNASDVDLCLLAGGSTLIPQVRDALRAFFPKACLAFSDDDLEAKLCVSRGAAWNAAFKAMASRPLIQPVLHDGIVLITEDGKVNPLIPSGSSLPYPEDGSFCRDEGLAVPRSSSGPVRELRLEVVGQLDKQKIFDEIWALPESAEPGDKIILEYRITGGKQFECRASLPARTTVPLEKTVENPLVNVANPNVTRLKIEQTEEDLRSRKGGTARDRDIYIELAKMYVTLKQHEKALDYLRTAQSRLPHPDYEILNLQGIYFDELGDHERAAMAYLESYRAEPQWSGALFNLALNYRRRDLFQEALETIEQALLKTRDPAPYQGLKAMLLDSLGQPEESRSLAAAALRAFDPIPTLDDWSLGWYLTTAQIAGNQTASDLAEAEQKKRKRLAKKDPDRDGVLRPTICGDGFKPSSGSKSSLSSSRSRRGSRGKQGS